MDYQDCVTYNIGGGLGLAAETRWPRRTFWFGLGGVEFDYSGVFVGDHRVGPAAIIGVAVATRSHGPHFAFVGFVPPE